MDIEEAKDNKPLDLSDISKGDQFETNSSMEVEENVLDFKK